MEWHHKKNDGDGTAVWQRLSTRDCGRTQSPTYFWKFICGIVDSKFWGAKFVKEEVAEPVKPVSSDLRPDLRVKEE